MSALMTVREVCSHLGLSKPDSVLALIHRGKLPAVNISAGTRPRWRIRPEDLEQFLRGRQAVPDGQAARPRRRSRRHPLLARVTRYL